MSALQKLNLTEPYRLHSELPNIPTATFEGMLKVEDPSLMRQALLQGLGRSKRYGCGLLLTAPASAGDLAR